MRFFRGDVSEAIAERESNGAAFVVFVEGLDELSSGYRAVLEGEDRIPESDYVAIRVEHESRDFTNFLGIYGNVPVPSVFVIGDNGLPLGVAAPPIENGELLRVIGLAVRKNKPKVRILLKLQTGETAVVEFPESSTLSELRSYVKGSLGVKYRFNMVTPFPKKIFTVDEEHQTLSSLGLNPKSTVLIVSAEKQWVTQWVYNYAAAVAADLLRSLRRILGRIRQCITRFLASP